MERQRRPGAAPGEFGASAMTAFRVVAALPDPIVLAAHPSYRRNPYEALLYGEAWSEGIAPVAMPRWSQLPELVDLQRAAIPTVLHLHWLTAVLKDSASVTEAEERCATFLDELDAYRAEGGRVAWTVHNVLPHESAFEAVEAMLCGAVAARADVIHIMSAATPAHVEGRYELPADRLLHVPHPSYIGVYPDHLSRSAARNELGIMPDELVVAAVGDIRPYKGLDDLLDAWALVPADRPRRLIIAGSPLDAPGVPAILERAALDPRVVLDARFVPTEEVQVHLRAADVAVLPYRRALNSGALMLALTFGLPVIAPDGTGMTEILDPSFAWTYAAGDRAALADALTRAADLATPAAAAAALAKARAHDPSTLSTSFAQGLRARLVRA
ncbi:MAG TPA: glycosyltransferase [Candidatus Limnocylindrales bacterium]|nr:glycosyltransferase [Candidatus Limnocylindrales bacterium]